MILKRSSHVERAVAPAHDIEAPIEHPISTFQKHQQDEVVYFWHFPLFNNEQYDKYQAYNRQSTNIILAAPLILVFYVNVVTRINSWTNDSTLPSVFFHAVIIIIIIETIIFSCHLIPRGLIAIKRTEELGIRLQKMFDKYSFGMLEDIIALVINVDVGFVLIGSVLAGQCDDLSSIWTTRGCNPNALTNSLPCELIFLMYSLPFMALIILGKISILGTTITWCFTFAMILFSICWLHAWHDLLILINGSIFVSLTYIVEFRMRVAYLHSKTIDQRTQCCCRVREAPV